ncbi:MAG TPA: hypothetical protein VKA37_09815, partial [Halobacteriales archaeon]|nr:hypothetical protein [Halobacteriales archaeon]
VDREADTPQTAIVLREAEENADEWIVYQDETVAHQNRMYDYADDEPVVLVAYEEILDENWEYWRAADPRDLFHGVLSRGIKFHAFPEARLRRVEE